MQRLHKGAHVLTGNILKGHVTFDFNEVQQPGPYVRHVVRLPGVFLELGGDILLYRFGIEKFFRCRRRCRRCCRDRRRIGCRQILSKNLLRFNGVAVFVRDNIVVEHKTRLHQGFADNRLVLLNFFLREESFSHQVSGMSFSV